MIILIRKYADEIETSKHGSYGLAAKHVAFTEGDYSLDKHLKITEHLKKYGWLQGSYLWETMEESELE